MKADSKYDLNKEQLEAIHHDTGPLLIIAGAGTGKTTVVTERIKWLLGENRARADEILALTFTEKASREMEERVDISVPYGATQMWISTFHSFCERVLRSDAISIGYDPGFRIMTEAETIQFFTHNLFKFNLNYYRPLGNPTKFIRGMITHFSRLKDEDIDPQTYEKWTETLGSKPLSRSADPVTRKNKESETDNNLDSDRSELNKYLELASAYTKYEELKIKNGLYDYGDLITNTLKLLRSRPDVLGNYQRLFKYILIDEFQDTNYSQNQLAQLLAGESKNITVVGDDDQAIYRFRGAAVSNIIQFRRTYPNAKLVVLVRNYRSTQEILNKSYQMVQNNNPDRLEIKEHIDKKLVAMRAIKGVPVEVFYENRVENEASTVAQKIMDLMADDRDLSYRDFAILIRANNHAEPFVRALSQHGIAYQFLGPGQLYRQAEVKDLIAYLKILANFKDNVAFYRVLNMDWVGITERDIAALMIQAKNRDLSVFEVCEEIATEEGRLANSDLRINGQSLSRIIEIVELIHRHLKLIKKETAGQILYYFLQDTGLLSELGKSDTASQERRSMNIAKFFDKIKTYETDHEDANVYNVVEWIDLSMQLGESPLATDMDWTGENAVNLLTVHSAKGLEFKVVFLVNLVAARFPTTQRRDQIPVPEELLKEILPAGDFHLQEERRLFYVGMTRARDRLFLTAAKYYGEGKREKKISPFVAEAVGLEAIPGINGEHENNGQLMLLDWAKVHESPATKIHIKPNYLSYSQIATFKSCPLQYKYRYVIKIPVPLSAALIFGDTMHRTLKNFYESAKKSKDPLKLDDLLHIYKTQWKHNGFANRLYEKKMHNKGEEILSEYFEKAYDHRHLPKFLEMPFRIKITDTLTLGGKIDRIDELENGRIEIIDYKTGSAPKTKDASADQQLSVYALAATTAGVLNKDPADVIVAFYFFETQAKVISSRTLEDLKELKSDISATSEQIANSDFRPTPGKQCDFCEFRLICEAWK